MTLLRRRRTVVAVLVALAALGCAPADEDGSAIGITVPPQPAPVPTSGRPITGTAPDDGTAPPARPSCDGYSANDQLPLRRCDRGELVQRVQSELAIALGVDIAADGYFGDATEAAVRSYQASSGLTADGLVGTETWNALFGSSLTTVDPTRGIVDDWYARPATEAVTALRELGFLVNAYEVCSSSVPADAVRQVLASDGTVLVDENGITAAGSNVSIGSVIEVKISNGTPC